MSRYSTQGKCGVGCSRRHKIVRDQAYKIAQDVRRRRYEYKSTMTVLYSVYPVTKQVQELLCCGGTPTMLRNEWRCGGARGDVDTVTEIRAGKVPMISVS